jgi:hypothetical protein
MLVIYNYQITSSASPPSKVRELNYTDIMSTSVSLIWEQTEDAHDYLIYRDDVSTSYPIYTTQLSAHFDNTVEPQTQYTYRVSARTEDCKEGEKSDPLRVTTPDGLQNNNPAQAITAECSTLRDPVINKTIIGTFQETLHLMEGMNHVVVQIYDNAGNVAQKSGDILLDTKRPDIERIDFDDHSPSYAGKITLNGKVSEQSTVYIFQNIGIDHTILVSISEDGIEIDNGENDNPRYVVETNENGEFSVDVTLQRDLIYRCDSDSINAPDCSAFSNNAWENNFEVIAVDNNGLSSDKYVDFIVYALCGRGSADWQIDTSEITPGVLIPRHLLRGYGEFGFSVDFNWQGPGQDKDAVITNVRLNTNPPMSREDAKYYDNNWIGSVDVVKSSDGRSAYFLVPMKALDPEGNTSMEKERNLSEHNLGNCAFGIGEAYGCARFFLMMEVHYSYLDPYSGEAKSDVYHQCWNQEIMIDRRLPSDEIPREFLNSTLEFLNTAIDTIDSILTPLRTLRNYVFMACLASWVVHWVMRAFEFFSCRVMTMDLLNNGCNPFDDDEDKADACKSCLAAKKRTYNLWKGSQWLCDRIICNSAPTFDSYVKDQIKNQESHCWELAKQVKDSGTVRTEKNKADAYSWDGDDKKVCSGQPGGEGGESFGREYEVLAVPRAYYTNDEFRTTIDEHYKPDDYTEDKPWLYSLECCKQEYMSQVNSICVVMNEIEESGCVNHAHRNTTELNDMGLSCGGAGGILRTITGICSSRGNEGNVVVSHYGSQPERTGRKLRVNVVTDAAGNRHAYALSEASTQIIEDPRDNTRGPGMQSTQIPAGPEETYYTREELILSSTECETGNGDVIDYNTWVDSLDDPKPAPMGVDVDQWVNQDIYYRVCTEQKENVVDPTSDILTSIRCVCLTALVSYLSMWKSVMVMARNCFQAILVTGDGSAGACQAFLSIYLCDLIYYAIKCIVERAGSSASGDRIGDNFLGGFLQYMRDSGSAVEGGVKNRYGQSSLYRTLFLERKLMHFIA